MDANATGRDQSTRDLDRQLDRTGWGLFLIMIGGLWLIPSVPSGLWLIGTAAIIFGLALVRYLNGIEVQIFSIGVGAAALLLGIAGLTGLDLPWFPILLIVIGASILIKRSAALR